MKLLRKESKIQWKKNTNIFFSAVSYKRNFAQALLLRRDVFYWCVFKIIVITAELDSNKMWFSLFREVNNKWYVMWIWRSPLYISFKKQCSKDEKYLFFIFYFIRFAHKLLLLLLLLKLIIKKVYKIYIIGSSFNKKKFLYLSTKVC